MLLNAFIIVWRESLEAMLVIGILAAWAATRPSVAREIALLALAGSWIFVRSMWPA